MEAKRGRCLILVVVILLPRGGGEGVGRHIGEPLCARCTGWPLAGILLSLLHGRSGLCTHCTDEKPKAQVKRLT